MKTRSNEYVTADVCYISLATRMHIVLSCLLPPTEHVQVAYVETLSGMTKV